MALTSVFYDGVVTETDRAKNRTGAADYGVYGVGDFEVKAHPSIPYSVIVKAGRAHGHGVTDEALTDEVVACSSLASGTRWDLIAVRRNWQLAGGGPSTLVAIQAGNTAAIPATRKIGPGVEDDQPLALVKWTGGLSAPSQIIDLRVWTAPGGLFAKDDLVRSYLTQIGTEVNISGSLWALTLGSNSTPAWVKNSEIGRVRLHGSGAWLSGDATPAGGDFLIQSGSLVATTDGGGYTRLTWPKPFPSGLLSIQLTAGDDWSNGGPAIFNVAGRPEIFGDHGFGSRTEVVYVMQAANVFGNNWGKAVNVRHRVNWVAIGW